MAQASLQRVNDERVIGRVIHAEQEAEAGHYDTALDLLLDAASLRPSPRTFDRVRSRYFQLLGQWFSEKISSERDTHAWKSIAVANFAGASDVEGCSIRDRIYSAMVAAGMENPPIILLSADAVAGLQSGALHQLSDRDIGTIRQAGVDAVVFGTLGQQLRGYLFDVKRQQAEPLLVVQPFSSVPGFPSSVQAWTRLPTKNATSRGLRVEVWTDRASYAVGDEVTFHIRSNKDCYVTLLDLQTSGGLYVLFPNGLQKDNHVRANQVYSIGDSQAAFSINASGPTGVEGVKAIASVQPLALALSDESSLFVAARSEEAQTRLCEQIESTVNALDPDSWDVADWTFEITRP
ncbi:MAG: DUF4384 domain-containing protein [Phycisphaerae bacterium]|nr:DUF4384 domain-containing protein [Phycisphaerae bacterium]